MSGPSHIPQLPMGFANDSPFPPMRSHTPSGAGPSRPSHYPQRPPPFSPAQMPSPGPGPGPGPGLNGGPPLPPLREQALQREQQLRQHHQSASAHGASYDASGRPMLSSPPLPQRAQSPIMPPGSFRPGFFTQSAAISPYHPPQPSPRMPSAAPARMPMPAPSPSPSPSPSPVPSTGPFPFHGRMPPLQPQRPIAQPVTPSHQARAGSSSLAPTTFDNMRLGPPQAAGQHGRRMSDQGPRPTVHKADAHGAGSPLASSSSSANGGLCAARPELNDLGLLCEAAFASNDDRRKVAWCKDVFRYVERTLEGNKISEPKLKSFIEQAMKIVNQLASAAIPVPDALYQRGDLLASGAFPSYHRKDLKAAFSDFELSARMGFPPSWFRIGRDYEMLGDLARARDGYERGCSVQDVGCIYRMGMANLLGQLELQTDHDMAIPLLKEAADLANVDTPQPSYVYGMLLAGEFSHVNVPKRLLVPSSDPLTPKAPATLEADARRRIQRAAYLNFAPAQYRCGWQYEYALLDCPFDPLLSVQYYSLASQGGEVEADLAISKWFLCGAEGCFDKNEKLAFTFAEKAAIKGLASAEFAMGYYFEVGVGCRQDVDVAQTWYKRAGAQGNPDAKERLAALAEPNGLALSRKQHEAHVDTQLQRKRTEAKMLSDGRRRRHSGGSVANASTAPPTPAMPGAMPLTPQQEHPPTASKDLQRRRTMRMVEEVANYPQGRRSSAPQTQEQPMPTAYSGNQNARLASVAPNTPPMFSEPFAHASQSHSTARPQNSRPSTAPQHIKNAALPPPPPSPSRHPRQPPSAASGREDGSGSSSSSSSSRIRNTSDFSGPTAASNGSSSGGGGIPVAPAPTKGPDKRVYETFNEMGIKTRKASDDKDCVVC